VYHKIRVYIYIYTHKTRIISLCIVLPDDGFIGEPKHVASQILTYCTCLLFKVSSLNMLSVVLIMF
jgi:hypothetical protein